jgi:hypothetical protein
MQHATAISQKHLYINKCSGRRNRFRPQLSCRVITIYEECRLLGCDAVLLVTANVVPRSLILFILMNAIRSSGTSVLTRAALCHISEGGVLHSRRCENLGSHSLLRIILHFILK